MQYFSTIVVGIMTAFALVGIIDQLFLKNRLGRLCARKTVILKNCYFTASVEQDWETNEHTAFSFG